MIGRCGSCRAPITWAATSQGTPQPIDPAPVANGNITLETHPRTGNQMSVPYSELLHKGQPRYQAHFVSCPHADAWRKDKAAPADTTKPRTKPRKRGRR